MKIDNEFTVSVPVQQAWDVMLDLQKIAPCLPGAAIKKEKGDGEYDGTMKVKIGPITANYKGTVKIEEADEENHRAVLQASGRDARGQGTASATIVSTLQEEGSDSTKVNVETDMKLTGRAAQFGAASPRTWRPRCSPSSPSAWSVRSPAPRQHRQPRSRPPRTAPPRTPRPRTRATGGLRGGNRCRGVERHRRARHKQRRSNGHRRGSGRGRRRIGRRRGSRRDRRDRRGRTAGRGGRAAAPRTGGARGLRSRRR